MAVQFVIGRAGAGKTHHCRALTLQACKTDPLGPPIYWIVPRQATFQTERALLETPDIPGIARVRVVSFESFAFDILSQTGGCAIPNVSDTGREMILATLLRDLAPRLQFFGAVATQSGLAAKLAGAFTELERSGADMTSLAALLDSSQAKAADLQLIHDHYTRFLGQDHLDAQRRGQCAVQAISACHSLRAATVYIDSFYDFAASERLMVAALAARCDRVSICLTLDPTSPVLADLDHPIDDDALFHRSEHAYRQLQQLFLAQNIRVDKPILLRQFKRSSSQALIHLEKWRTPPVRLNTTDDVSLIETPDLRSELDAVARQIQTLVHSGLRYRDIVVITRDLRDYADLLAATLAEHNIPFFMDRRRPATHHPLIQFVRNALAIIHQDWPSLAVTTWLKTGLTPLASAEVDALENYCLLHGITKINWLDPSPWTGRRNPLPDEDLIHDQSDPDASAEPHAIDALRRRAMAPLLPFAKTLLSRPSHPVRAYCQALYALCESAGVPEKIAQWVDNAVAAQQVEIAAECEQVWREFIELLDQMVEVLGSRELPLADFISVLETALNRFDLALTPPTLDQVLIAQIDRVRVSNARAAIVVGLNHGEFPRVRRQDSVLNDADRRSLRARALDVDANAQRELNHEHFLGYLAFTRASQTLVLLRSLTDAAGNPTLPGAFWLRAQSALPNLPLQRLTLNDIHHIASPRQLLTHLMQWVRTDATAAPDSPAAALYQYVSQRAAESNHHDALAHLTQKAWPALRYANQCALSPEIAGRLFSSPLSISAAQLEAFACCPFQHFLKFGLSLAPRGAFSVTGKDLSVVYHDVLNRLLKQLLADRQNWLSVSQQTLEHMVSDLVQRAAAQLQGNWMLGDARHRYLLSRIERTLLHVVAAQRAAAQRGTLQPAFPSLRYGPNGDLPALQVDTPNGHHLELAGVIDRVDVSPNTRHASVIDYRLKAKPFPLSQAYWGLSFKWIIDLLALSEGRAGLHPPVPPPAAYLHVPLLREIKDKLPDDALECDDPRFPLREKPRGLFHNRAVPALDNTLSPGEKSDVVHLHIKLNGDLGSVSDAATPEQFTALLAHTRALAAQLADAIMTGATAIHPYRLGNATPCPSCAYRGVCRFDPRAGYREVQVIRRNEVLQLLDEQQSDDDESGEQDA